ncbi:hypothetical protein [Methanobrevibacter sp.]|uniref:hypothetical protein n=1 Tax=Methanobrevibacter sp. TaxID=66852 RepID=UPI00388ECE33
MYFSSLINPELELYHKLINVRNMSLSLSDILGSDLFKTVSLGSGLYKIFPLFYCKQITSNNDKIVKILENKCIITTNTNNLFFNFITDNEDIVIFDDTAVPLFDISDSVSTEEFNNYIQLLRNNIEFKDNISINEGLVHGTYADYSFSLDNVTVVDNGILITEETLSSTATVRLVDPIFKNNNYQMKVNVFSVSDVNVMDSNRNNIVTDTLTIDLEEFEDVVIPLSDLDFNMIVGFDAEILIKQDKPIIKLTKTLELIIGSGPYYIGDSLTLSAQYKMNSVAGGSGVEVTFRNRNNTLGTGTTNSSGIAMYNYTPNSVGEYIFKGVITADAISSDNLSVNVVKKPTTITLAADHNAVVPGSNITISGTLKFGTTALSNKTVSLVTSDGDTFSLTTDSNGAFSKILSYNGDKQLTVSASYAGDGTYTNVDSEFIVVRWINTPGTVTLASNSNSVKVGDTVTLTATVLNTLDSACSGFDVKFYNGNLLLGTEPTNANGVATFDYVLSTDDDLSLTAKCEEVTSSAVSVTVSKYETALTCGVSNSNVNVGANITVSGRLTAGGSGVASKQIKIYHGSSFITTVNTDSSGNYSTSINCNCMGTWLINAVFSGDNEYESKTSSSNYVSINGYASSITCNVNNSEITPNDSVTVYGTVSVGNANIYIYKNNTYVTSARADSSGNYSTTISGLGIGSYTIKAQYNGSCTYYSSNSSVNVTVKNQPTLTCTLTPPSSIYVDTTLIISGNLSAGANKTVKIQNGSAVLYTLTTDSNGDYSQSVNCTTTGIFHYKAVFDGDNDNYSVETQNKQYRVREYDTEFRNCTYRSDGRIEGYLYNKITDEPISNQTITIKNLDGTVLEQQTTNSSGYFMSYYNSYLMDVKLVFASTNKYKSCNTTVIWSGG